MTCLWAGQANAFGDLLTYDVNLSAAVDGDAAKVITVFGTVTRESTLDSEDFFLNGVNLTFENNWTADVASAYISGAPLSGEGASLTSTPSQFLFNRTAGGQAGRYVFNGDVGGIPNYILEFQGTDGALGHHFAYFDPFGNNFVATLKPASGVDSGFLIGSASAVPEPAALSFVLIGVGLVGMTRRRRK
ncbi:MAG: PEP-CTERM sorting domain-containing protein [Mariniblastus sp.]|nr:PEP-CTERM sorting domain-containing protein [Mariniblastus sp.]